MTNQQAPAGPASGNGSEHEAYRRLLARVNEIHDLNKAGALLGWDREVIMPQAAQATRIKQQATVRRLAHERSTSDETGQLIADARQALDGSDPDSIPARLVRYVARDYEEARRLPPEFVARVSEVSGHARTAWAQAREHDTFDTFRPWLERVVALGRELAELRGYDDERYDALLEIYERGMTTADVRALFARLTELIAPLLEAIAERVDAVDDGLLHQPYDVGGQRAFGRYIAAEVGYDFERGHLGTALHPFATSLSRNDARITTRWNPSFLSASLFGVLHESGHAMYEQGTDPRLARTPLARGTSSGVHESQSRLVENIVGRSRGFWQRHYAKLKETFPEQLGPHDAEAFYRAINKVRPSLIRVEADELTYNLHIVLRFELEQALIADELPVAELPTAWNDRMATLLGVRPPSDREGVLQDIHWSRPSFGYFPTYALGNLYAAQLYETACGDDAAVEDGMAEGDPAPLVRWLRVNIHQPGRMFDPDELIVRATGRPLEAEPFGRYVSAKFSEIYDL